MTVKKKIDIALEQELGSRPQKQTKPFILLSTVAFLWALLQLYVASPLTYHVAILFKAPFMILNEQQLRNLHLLFGMGMVLIMFPRSTKDRSYIIPWYDWLLLSFTVASILYLCIFYDRISYNIGLTSPSQTFMAVVSLLILLEATRRSVGTAMMVLAGMFLFYSYFGNYFPTVLLTSKSSIVSIVTHQWFTSEGVFGTAIGVSADFVFLYVLFGNLLEKTGAGDFFIKLAFALLGSFRGGPAKASVVASGLMGMISGSSIANTITVGSLTIPIMKKLGFPAKKAAAIEVSAGVNGQLMPPVMGAAAFLMAEYLSIPYDIVIKHAFLPAILVYLSLLYMVRAEAIKLNLNYHDVESRKPFLMFLRLSISLSSIVIIVGSVYFLIEGLGFFLGIKRLFGHNSIYVVSGLLFVIYVLIVYYNRNIYDLDETLEQEQRDILNHNESWQRILRKGFHYIIPIFLIVWLLIVERLSPSLAAYWTVLFLFIILVTHDVLVCIMRKNYKMVRNYFYDRCKDVVDSLISTSRNMAVVAVATATAGIIVGSVSLTGIGLKFSGLIDLFSFGNLVFALLITGFVCIILGMGMPTTACYIIVATIMVPVLKHITYIQGIYVLPLSLHLFVFYFGILADVTPPVGLASYTSSAIAGSNPLQTGVQAFYYNIRTIIVPFLFIFNHKLIYYNIFSMWDGIFVTLFAVIGIIVISASMQSYFLTKNTVTENILFFILGLLMMCPNIITENSKFIKYHDYNVEQDIIAQEIKDGFELLKINTNSKFDNVDRTLQMHSPEGVLFYSVKHALIHLGIKQYTLIDNNTIRIDNVLKNSVSFAMNIKNGDIIRNISIAKYTFGYYQVCVFSLCMFLILVARKIIFSRRKC